MCFYSAITSGWPFHKIEQKIFQFHKYSSPHHLLSPGLWVKDICIYINTKRNEIQWLKWKREMFMNGKFPKILFFFYIYSQTKGFLGAFKYTKSQMKWNLWLHLNNVDCVNHVESTDLMNMDNYCWINNEFWVSLVLFIFKLE